MSSSDLAVLGVGRMHDRHPRTVAKLNALLCDRECTRDQSLRRDDGCRCRQRDQRIEHHPRTEVVERILRHRCITEQQCSLPEIVEEERGQHEGEPGRALP